jgi:predicted porin
MQKKIIALAVAAMASGAAFAQSNVTVYGIVDVGYAHTSGSENDRDSRTGLDSGLQSGSRIGFRGTEDLGNGLKASFVLEYGLAADTGVLGTTARQSLLALSGNFGTVAAGRQYTPQYGLVAKVDPFGTGTVGDAAFGRGVYTMATGRLIGTAVPTGPNEIRLNNLIAYVSPNFGGFNVVAGYTANGLADEEATLKTAKSGDTKVWAINPNYSAGPLFVGLNYHKVKNEALDADSAAWDIGATYDFGAAKLHALVGQNKDEVGAADHKDKKWLVGVSAPIGKFNVMASYARLKSDGDVAAIDGNKSSKWALGTTYSLSKRTNVYAAYAKISNNDEAEGRVSVRAPNYTSGLNIGVRHSF